jgi:hypothetical protein
MLTNLASTAAASVLQDSPRPGVTGVLPVANGGTGASTAAEALKNFGLAVKSNGWTTTLTLPNLPSGNMAIGAIGTTPCAIWSGGYSLVTNLPSTATASRDSDNTVTITNSTETAMFFIYTIK